MKVIEMRTDENGETSTDYNYWLPGNCHEKELNLPPKSRIACALIPIPDGYRLWTKEEQEKYPRSEVYKHLQCVGLGGYATSTGNAGPYSNGVIYVIREDWKPEPKLEVTVTVNGEKVDPSTISAETWESLRTGDKV